MTSIPEILFVGLTAPRPLLCAVAKQHWREITCGVTKYHVIEDGEQSPGFFDWLRGPGMSVCGIRWDRDAHNRFVGEVALAFHLNYVVTDDNYYHIGFGVNPSDLYIEMPERMMGTWLYKSTGESYGVGFALDLMEVGQLVHLVKSIEQLM